MSEKRFWCKHYEDTALEKCSDCDCKEVMNVGIPGHINHGMTNKPEELAREVQRLQEEGLHPTKACVRATKQLAQMVLDASSIQLLPRGKQIPQTPEAFTRLAEQYEKTFIRQDKENRQLRERINKLEQKYVKTKQEQQEKDAKLVEAYIDECMASDYENKCFTDIAKAIREG